MKLKAILTDLDGTLINSIPLIMASDKAAIEHFGFKVTHQQLRELSQLHSRDIAYHLMDKSKKTFNLFAFINYRRAAFVKLLKKTNEHKLWFKGAKEFLENTSQNFPIAIVTGSRMRFINEVFDKKIKKIPSVIITSDEVEHKKPDIEPLLVALKCLKVKSDEVIFIGDSIQDALMCQRLGVRFIAKIGGISTENQLRKFNPLFVAKDFEEISRFIELLS